MRACSRILTALTAALALACGLAGTAGAHPGHTHAKGLPAFGGMKPAPASAYRGLTKNPSGRCGATLYEVRTKDKRGRGRVGCTHGPDAAPLDAAPLGEPRSLSDLRTATAALEAAAGAGSATVPCDGEHSTGMRVTAIYAHTADEPDRYAEVAPLIRKWAAQVEDVYYESARETGGSRSLRWLTEPSPTGACRVKVEKVTLTAAGDDSFGNTSDELSDNHGATSGERRYLVWLDGPSELCGIGLMGPDDRPGPENMHNGGPDGAALVSRVDTACWGSLTRSTEAHELGHNLGAVQDSAPNTSGGGHCVDEWDVMCYSDSPHQPAMVYVCGTLAGDRSHDNRLDCGHDDYFSTAPPAGSYLATHWNIANNNFLREGRIVHDATSLVATGDGDQVAEPGETVSFNTRVQNRAQSTATGVSGTVSSPTTDSTPAAGTKAYPDIAANGTGTNATPYGLTIKNTVPCGAVVPATVTITASSGTHQVPVGIPTGAPGAPVTTNAAPGATIPDNNPTGVTTTLTLPAGGRVADLDVKLNISHFYVQDLEAYLTGPDGTTVELFRRVGGNGWHFENTVLDDEAATAIEAGAAPFTGSFRPSGSLAAFDGKPVGGTWTLKVVDLGQGDDGKITSWGVTRRALACSVAAPATTPDPSGWSAAPTSAKGDVNGDGVSDLVVGAPSENFGRGAVHVIYGTAANGLAATGSQLITQDTPDVADTAEADDRFGASIAVGDLNGDGKADVAVGAPGEDTPGGANSGAVHVLFGGAGGLTAAGSQQWLQGAGGLGEAQEAGDRFGAALAIGDVGKSTHGDLAVGVPDEDLAVADAGVVQVLHGSATGPTAAGAQLWSQGAGGLAETAEAGDRFGASLAVGNVGRSAHRDLAVGAPWEDLTGAADAGVVQVIYGGTTGLSATNAQVWSQNSADVEDAAEAGDHFGAALASGDLGKTLAGDLAIGVPDENLGAVADAGIVHVLYATDTGLTATGSQLWSQESTGIDDAAEATDRFGISLAIGNFGRSAQRDLAIGVPTENLAVADAGVVHAVYGTASGLSATNSQLWSQETAGIDDGPESGDKFGARLATGQYGRSTQEDLVVGVPAEDAGAVDSGLAHAIYGSTSGLAALNSQLWSQAPADIADAAEATDAFGGGLGR